jgi:LmbE family N-acetylglucosaminyl deacetylase
MQRRVLLQRACLAVILLVYPVLAWADGEPGSIKRSIVLVFDLSHSMLTVDPSAGASRYTLGLRAVEKLSESAAEDEEWALVLADDAGAAATAGEFTTDLSSLMPKLQNTEPWGTTSLDEMVRAGMEQLARSVSGTDRFIILITDGINTHGPLYNFPSIDPGAASSFVPVVLGFPVGEYDGFRTKVSDWIEASDGVFLFHHQTNQLRSIFDPEQLSQVGESPNSQPGMTGELPEVEEADTAPVLFSIWWIFLIPFAGTGAFMISLYSRWSAKRRVIQGKEAERREIITLTYSTHGGETERRTFDSFPVKVAGGAKADLALEKPRISTGARSFSILKDDKGFSFSAGGLFVINGVGRRNMVLSGGERITFGRYRVVFEGISYISPPAMPSPAPHFLLLLIPLIAFMVLSIVFREPIVLMRPLREPPFLESPAGELPASETPANETPANETPPQAESGTTSLDSPASPSAINTFPTVMWDPGDQPDFFKIDALFLHAHPDDESLDFGILLRRLADAGKRVAVVLFTDGGAGLDQYPRRFVGEDYPAYDLRGGALSVIRKEEARSAMSVLGVSHYVRLGLENSPYGGVTDVKTTSSVAAAWGGEAVIVERLVSLIAGYKPEIVVSPDRPSEALEHFEHETVGMLVEATLKKLRSEGGFIPSGRLVSIDPMQKALYPDAVGINAVGIDSTCGLTYRAIQAAALAEHQTQRDASVIGVENLSGFNSEYYRMLSWDLPLSIETYLTP